MLKLLPARMNIAYQWDLGDMEALGVVEAVDGLYNIKFRLKAKYEDIKPYWY